MPFSLNSLKSKKSSESEIYNTSKKLNRYFGRKQDLPDNYRQLEQYMIKHYSNVNYRIKVVGIRIHKTRICLQTSHKYFSALNLPMASHLTQNKNPNSLPLPTRGLFLWPHLQLTGFRKRPQICVHRIISETSHSFPPPEIFYLQILGYSHNLNLHCLHLSAQFPVLSLKKKKNAFLDTLSDNSSWLLPTYALTLHYLSNCTYHYLTFYIWILPFYTNISFMGWLLFIHCYILSP